MGTATRPCKAQHGVVVLDEAYVDFAKASAMDLALKYPHVLVARTFSKAYSLCFQRVGYFVGHPELIAALHKIARLERIVGTAAIAAALRYFSFRLWGHDSTPVSVNLGNLPNIFVSYLFVI